MAKELQESKGDYAAARAARMSMQERFPSESQEKKESAEDRRGVIDRETEISFARHSTPAAEATGFEQ